MKQDLRSRIFRWIHEVSTGRPKLVLGVMAMVGASSIVASVFFLKLESDQDKLISERVPHHKKYLEFTKAVGDQEFIYAVIEGASQEEYAKFAEAFDSELKKYPDLFLKRFYKLDLTSLIEKGLFFQNASELKQIRIGLAALVKMVQDRDREISKEATKEPAEGKAESKPKSSRYGRPPPPIVGEDSDGGLTRAQGKKLYFQGYSIAEIRKIDEELRKKHQEEIRRGQIPEPMPTKPKSEAEVDTFDDSFLNEAFLDAYSRILEKNARPAADLESPLQSMSLLDVNQTTLYLSEGSQSKPFFLFLILPKKDYTKINIVEKPLQVLKQIRVDLSHRFPNIRVGFTGRPILQADEMETTDRDTRMATVFSIIGVLLLIAWGFREFRHPLAGMVALGLGVCYTFGFTTAVFGHLNILSIVFVTILIGCGIEYAIQMIARYKEEVLDGKSVREALGVSMQTANRGSLTGMLTSAVAFITPIFSDFRGLTELGIIAAGGLLLCYSSISFGLPALITILDRGRESQIKAGGLKSSHLGFLGFVFRYPKTVFGFCILSSAGCILAVPRLRLNYNILELQSQSLESVRLEHKMMTESRRGTWYSGRIFDNLADERRFVDQARKELKTVSMVEASSDMIPQISAEKRKSLASIRKLLSGTSSRKIIRFVDQEVTLEVVNEGIGRIAEDRSVSENLRNKALWFEKFEKNNPERIRRLFPKVKARVLEALFAWLQYTQQGLKTLDFDPKTVLPPLLRDRFFLNSGKSVVFLYPKGNIWNDALMKAHVSELSHFDPMITGPTFSVYFSSKMMTDTFRWSAILSLLFVFLCVWMDFRRMGSVVSSFLPICFGISWLACFMAICGKDFNLANFFAIPILIGVGIDNGVQMANRFRESRSARKVMESTGIAVLLTALTTCVSFGSLAVAHHRGIASLGLLVTVGMIACLLGALVGLSSWFQLLENRNKRRSA